MGVIQNPAQTLQSERLRFPGMLPREIIIFRNWLRMYETQYDRIEYNVRIGSGLDPGPTWPDYVRQSAIANTQLRIDAVAYKGDAVTLIEVKDKAGASALGQLLTYEAVWLEDHPGSAPPALTLITNRLQNNLLPLLRKSNIHLDLVQADFSELRSKAYVPGF